MTRYYMPVALSEQFHAVVIMPSKDITMQDIRISKFQSDLFFAQNCLLLSSSGLPPLLPSEESQKNLTTTSMISTTITVPVTLSLSSQEESHVRRFQPRVASPVTSVQTNSLTRLATLVGVS